MTFCRLIRSGLLTAIFLFTVSQCPASSLLLQEYPTDKAKSKSSKENKQKTKRDSGSKSSSELAKKSRMRLYGELVEGGAECQRFRTFDNKYYTLEGDLRGFRTGDTVEITGVIPNASHCMQDTPVRVQTIRRAKPPGSRKGSPKLESTKKSPLTKQAR